jgi:hypothetical protein
MNIKRMIAVFLALNLLLILAACNMPEKFDLAAIPSGPRAWIDAPRNHSTLPFAPYEVVFHGSDPGGVALAELSINGRSLLPSQTMIRAAAWSPSGISGIPLHRVFIQFHPGRRTWAGAGAALPAWK